MELVPQLWCVAIRVLGLERILLPEARQCRSFRGNRRPGRRIWQPELAE